MDMTAEITEQPVPAVQEPDDVSSAEAPYGWMTDPVTQERRPKKRPGRRSRATVLPTGNSPAIEELQAAGSLTETSEDTAPGAAPKGSKPKPPKEVLPPLRAGLIAKAINRQYRRAGRIIKLFDIEIGTAVIACTKADPDAEDGDTTTVGEAWEELAKTNPRVRALLMNFVRKGAWANVIEMHLPILLAVMLKDGIQRRLPLAKLAGVFLTEEDDDGTEAGPSGMAQMMGGINPNDLGQMMAVAQQMMGQIADQVPRPANTPREPVNGHPWADQGPREHAAGPEQSWPT